VIVALVALVTLRAADNTLPLRRQV
jgi:hypothetical protein